jgi:major type 1 subunit fimbrin (pilin)
MNIRVKRAMLAAGIVATMALPLSSQASDGTITFTGAVTASTCTLSVNGGANAGTATVALPTVDTAALTNTGAGTTAAGTFFSVGVSACSAVADIGAGPAAPTQVALYFEAGPNVDEATGGLINTVAGSNVEVNLYNASGSTIVGTQIKPGTNTNQPAAQSIAAGGTQWFYAGYSTAGAGAAATAGAVSTSITYSLIYQ